MRKTIMLFVTGVSLLVLISHSVAIENSPPNMYAPFDLYRLRGSMDMTPALPYEIEPIDFKPFVDGRNWIVRGTLRYWIGNSQDYTTVPKGFVTDFASIPPKLKSFIQQNSPLLLPAVMHDYLYWKQTCTRKQADKILRLAMIEHHVPETQRIAIYQALRIARGSAWNENAQNRRAGMVRILPTDRQKITARTLWPSYQ